MTTLIIVLACTYVFIAGLIGSTTRRILIKRHGCNGGHHHYGSGTCTRDAAHWPSSVTMAVVWPLGLTFVAGMVIGNLPRLRADRSESRRKRELEEARHQTVMAQERALQAKAVEDELRVYEVNNL